MWSEHSFEGPFGETLVLSETANETSPLAIVVMFHGFGFQSRGLSATNTNLSERLLPLGVRCVACDLSGHGESDGDIADQSILKASAEIESFVDYVRRNFDGANDGQIGLVGNSFSGGAAIIAAARMGNTLGALALKAPVSDYVAMRSQMLGFAKMEEWEHTGNIVLPNGTPSKWKFIEDASQVDLYAKLKEIQAPVLAVQGTADEEIPMASCKKLSLAMEEAGMTYVPIEGGNHSLSDPYFLPATARIATHLATNLGVHHPSGIPFG